MTKIYSKRWSSRYNVLQSQNYSCGELEDTNHYLNTFLTAKFINHGEWTHVFEKKYSSPI